MRRERMTKTRARCWRCSNCAMITPHTQTAGWRGRRDRMLSRSRCCAGALQTAERHARVSVPTTRSSYQSGAAHQSTDQRKSPPRPFVRPRRKSWTCCKSTSLRLSRCTRTTSCSGALTAKVTVTWEPSVSGPASSCTQQTSMFRPPRKPFKRQCSFRRRLKPRSPMRSGTRIKHVSSSRRWISTLRTCGKAGRRQLTTNPTRLWWLFTTAQSIPTAHAAGAQ